MSSDAEMDSPPRRSGKKDTKKKGKKAPSPDVQEEEEEEDDGYEIDAILKAQKGIFAPGRWAYYVSWKNYGSEDDSWVDEPDFFAKDMIEEFWKKNPDHKGNPLAKKGRKSEAGGASSRVSSSNAGKSRKSVADEEESEEEKAKEKEKEKEKPTKRKPASSSKKRVSEEAEPTPESDQEEERPKKKSRTKKQQPAADSPPNGFFDEPAEPSSLQDHTIDAMAKHMSKKSWEKLITTIETVERQEDGTLLVYYTATDGTRAISESKVLAEKAPQRLIEFYEGHLRWRGTSQFAE